MRPKGRKEMARKRRRKEAEKGNARRSVKIMNKRVTEKGKKNSKKRRSRRPKKKICFIKETRDIFSIVRTIFPERKVDWAPTISWLCSRAL